MIPKKDKVRVGRINVGRTMSENFARLGEVLRAKRQEMQLSLKEIENSTSIRASYLEAIEDGQIQRYISGVYALGFLRQYATFLGLDIEGMIRQNPAAFRLPTENHDFAYGIGTLESRGNTAGGGKAVPNVVWVGIAALVLGGAWYLAKWLGVV